MPGVVPQGTTDGNALTGKNVFAAGNYQIGGGIANQSATYYDGVPANAGVGNLVNMVPSPDAISEFRVQTNSNSAEFGRYAGGVINVTSKSGTNEFHGSAYEFFRNKVLNANTLLRERERHGKAGLYQNQYGLTGGGPVKKNKIFFFAAWEGYDSRQGATFLATVPLPAMYSGDFSGYKNSSGAMIPIYDPLTQCGQYSNAACRAELRQPFSAARTPFPGNIIPSSRIQPGCGQDRGIPDLCGSQPAGAAVHAEHQLQQERRFRREQQPGERPVRLYRYRQAPRLRPLFALVFAATRHSFLLTTESTASDPYSPENLRHHGRRRGRNLSDQPYHRSRRPGILWALWNYLRSALHRTST